VTLSAMLRLVVLLAYASTAQAQAIALTHKDESDILRIVSAIKAAIVRGSTADLLRLVSPTLGLTCSGKAYPYPTVAQFLSEKKSYLYMGLFDSAALARACSHDYPDVSEQEFLSGGTSTDHIVSLGPDWVEVTVSSKIQLHAPRVWSLHREAGSWKLADGSLIVGSCSCA
jgi:hypothetical protein